MTDQSVISWKAQRMSTNKGGKSPRDQISKWEFIHLWVLEINKKIVC